MPIGPQHLDFLIAHKKRGYREYEMMIEALTRLEPDETKRRKALEILPNKERKVIVEAATQSFPIPFYYPELSQWFDGLSGE